MAMEAWAVLAVLVAVLVVMALDRFPAAVAMGGGLLALVVTGVIDEDVATSGLASAAPVTIAALYVVAAAVAATGAMSWVIDRLLLGSAERQWRFAAATAATSAFVPNTPLVAFLAPRVVAWCRERGVSASRLLMPLSYASILGGVVTLLGTSTNLVVSDALRAAGHEPLGVFEVTPVGLPVALAGVVLLGATAPLLLRDREPAADSLRRTARCFQVQMIVADGGPLVGATVAGVGLRDLDGLFLAAVERADVVSAASADTRLAGGDRLYFVGDVAGVVGLHDRVGLRSAEHPHVLGAEGAGTRLYEAVLAPGSELAGSTLRAVGFRGRYGAAVVGVHRAAGDVRGKLGRITLHAGDVLLVLGDADFARRWREHGDFSLVASLDEPPPVRRSRAGVAAGAMIGLVALAASGVLEVMTASLVAATAVVVGGAIGLADARRAVDLNVVLTVALSVSLGAAVADSGLADAIAGRLVRIGDPGGTVLLLLAVVLTTQALTELLANSGAAALMVPVAISAATDVGADPRAFALAVLIGASCSFLTPIGYQTNLMVYGLGGYRFADFARLGLPLTLSSALVATLLLA